MTPCNGCGRTDTPIRVDGYCFGCHVRSIGFTYAGGAVTGRSGWNITQREFIERHVGEDRIRSGEVERAN